MNPLDDVVKLLKRITEKEGVVVSESQTLGNAGFKMHVPLRDRISPNKEEAIIRRKIELGEAGESMIESEAEQEAITDRIVEKMADDILKRLLG
jgi:hypothetical protein